MSLGFRNEIDIMVSLAAGAVSDVAILPRSRPPLTQLFAGKPAGSLAAVLPRLFSLCAVAHQVAFLTAVEAARGKDAAPEAIEHRRIAVIAERLAELVRGLFIGRQALDRDSAAAVRAIMQATAALGAGEHERCSRREAVLQIRTALRGLGIGSEDRASSLVARLTSFDPDVLRPLEAKQVFLSAADDFEIVTRLLADGTDFSDAPELSGQVPETGVWARRIGREPTLPLDAGPIARLKARVAEIAGLCAWLEGEDKAVEGRVVERYRLGAGKGAAAVECARGRLYHAVELDDEDHIIRFEFLAPTEWNFHARGPLVRSLQGAALAAGPQGQDAVRYLVESFDPCVGFSLSFREAGHA